MDRPRVAASRRQSLPLAHDLLELGEGSDGHHRRAARIQFENILTDVILRLHRFGDRTGLAAHAGRAPQRISEVFHHRRVIRVLPAVVGARRKHGGSIRAGRIEVDGKNVRITTARAATEGDTSLDVPSRWDHQIEGRHALVSGIQPGAGYLNFLHGQIRSRVACHQLPADRSIRGSNGVGGGSGGASRGRSSRG